MLCYNKIDVNERVDLAKSNNSKKKTWFVTIFLLIMDSNFIILCTMIIVICQLCVLIEAMMIMMMNSFSGMVDWRKALSLISSQDHCQRSSPSRISDTPLAGFEPAQNLSSGLVEWSCAATITTTPRRYSYHRC